MYDFKRHEAEAVPPSADVPAEAGSDPLAAGFNAPFDEAGSPMPENRPFTPLGNDEAAESVFENAAALDEAADGSVYFEGDDIGDETLDLTDEADFSGGSGEEAADEGKEAEEEGFKGGVHKDEPRGPDYSSEADLLALVDRLVNHAGEAGTYAECDEGEMVAVDFDVSSDDDDQPAPTLADRAPSKATKLFDLEVEDLTDEDFQRLRELILGREIAAVENIHQYLNDPASRARSISQVITEAILLRNKKDNRLETVLKTTVEHIFRNSVRQKPDELADSLFPVIGPAIRRSISESIKGMFQDFSRTLEMSFSAKGLKWRLEALRTGRTFSEVVLLNTIEYQVEQLFLVKSGTGELLDHLVAEGALAQDGDQVAAMLTAIQQFVNDSFAQGGLNNLEFGDVTVLVVHSSLAYIACVVRGQIPSHLRTDLQKALELIVMEYGDEIENFRGDGSVFRTARRHVEGLVTAKYKADATKSSLWARLAPFVVLAMIIGGAGFYLYKDHQMQRLENLIFHEAIGSGFIPVRVEPSFFQNWEITYLRDDLSDDPAASLQKLGLDMGKVLLTELPYISQDAKIVERRVNKILGERPPGFQMHFHDATNTLTFTGTAPIIWAIGAYERLSSVPGVDFVVMAALFDPVEKVVAGLDRAGTLHLEGEASGVWIENLKEKALATSGVKVADFSRLRDPVAERLAARRAAAEAEVNALTARVNSTVILFPVNQDAPVPQDLPKLNRAIDDLIALEKLAMDLRMSIGLTIYGHADATGSARRNYELSQERTKTLAAMLYARGSRISITNYGMGADFAKSDGGENPSEDQSSRKIELKVHLTPLTAIEK